MGDRQPHSTNNPNQSKGRPPRTKTRISGYLAGEPKPVKTDLVDPGEERRRRLMWWLKWVILLPLSVYALCWLLVILIDLFKY